MELNTEDPILLEPSHLHIITKSNTINGKLLLIFGGSSHYLFIILH